MGKSVIGTRQLRGAGGKSRPPRLLLPISLFKFAYFLLDTRKFVSPCVRKRLVFLLPASNSSISWSSSQERRGRLRHPRNSKQCQ